MVEAVAAYVSALRYPKLSESVQLPTKFGPRSVLLLYTAHEIRQSVNDYTFDGRCVAHGRGRRGLRFCVAISGIE